MGTTCWMILVSYVFRSLYVQAKTSLYWLKILMKLSLSAGEKHFPRFTYLGFVSVPKFINSNCRDELWVFTFAGLLNFSFKSNIRSKVLTPLGMKLSNFSSAWCSSSSIIAPLNTLSFVKHSIIYWSSSNTRRLVIMSGTEGMKSNSTEHWLLVGTSLVADVVNKSATAFLSIVIAIILNSLKGWKRPYGAMSPREGKKGGYGELTYFIVSLTLP